mmetsp:Transcript_12093/g.22631  ORF Transcript_12093/g.22631 Transcript_12093/m.22631 type:complete len:93 (-) Transcript_12093:11-289(-)
MYFSMMGKLNLFRQIISTRSRDKKCCPAWQHIRSSTSSSSSDSKNKDNQDYSISHFIPSLLVLQQLNYYLLGTIIELLYKSVMTPVLFVHVL